MLTCRAMRWKLSGPKPVRPRGPYHRTLPHRLPIALLTVLERSSADSLGASFLSFLCMSVYIYIFYSILFPWAAGFRLMSVRSHFTTMGVSSNGSLMSECPSLLWGLLACHVPNSNNGHLMSYRPSLLWVVVPTVADIRRSIAAVCVSSNRAGATCPTLVMVI
jgi:hypothetical protein